MAGTLPYAAAFLGFVLILCNLPFLVDGRFSIKARIGIFALGSILLSVAAYAALSGGTSASRIADTRSEAQKAFDSAFDEYADGSSKALIENLRAYAAKLDPNDSLDVDLVVLSALGSPKPQRLAKLESYTR